MRGRLINNNKRDMLSDREGSGSGGVLGVPTFLSELLFDSYSNYTIPKSGYYTFFIWGGGGGGALAAYDDLSIAGGGGSGAFTRITLYLVQSASCVITPGSGGASLFIGEGEVGGITGNDGQDSTVAVNGVTWRAKGGQGGRQVGSNSSTANQSIVAAAGGAISSGDVSIAGSNGAYASWNDATNVFTFTAGQTGAQSGGAPGGSYAPPTPAPAAATGGGGAIGFPTQLAHYPLFGPWPLNGGGGGASNFGADENDPASAGLFGAGGGGVAGLGGVVIGSAQAGADGIVIVVGPGA